MTLPASFPISASQINVELGRAPTAAFDIQGAEERALAEVPSGAISMSDFLGKSSFEVLPLGEFSDSIAGSSDAIAGVDFGTANSGRRMFMQVHLFGLASGERTLTAATIGGIAATIHDQSFRRNTGTNDAHLTSIISAAVPTGTSGTVAITLDGTFTGTFLVESVSTKGLVGGSPTDTMNAECAGDCSSLSGTLNVPAAGVVFAAATGVSTGGGENLTMTQPTPPTYDGAEYAGAILSGQASNPFRSISASITGSNSNIGLVAVSWQGV